MARRDLLGWGGGVAASLCLLAGCGGGSSVAPPPPANTQQTVHIADRQAPTITLPRATPDAVGFGGGAVTLSANVVDRTSGVDSVWAMVTVPKGAPVRVPLSAVGGDTYSASWPAPANFSPDKASCKAQVYATDNEGNEGRAGTIVTITVDGLESPPGNVPL